MRDNGPVTQREVFMKDGSCIVSKTDEKGRILFINEDFVDISGFTRDELLGQPHNLIRHSDMPKEAFEDMWRDLKAGKPWSGYVKNRVKNGDHYWVLANAMPVVENGAVTGYVSIRSKPDPQVVEEVASTYQDFREGKAKGLSILHGRIMDHSSAATVKEISTQLQKTTLLVSESQSKTQDADSVAGVLSEATGKVAAAMNMIADIAGQINLLALNATIESARAGDAGKGFAVVASEVKNLANQADKTSNEIQTVVEEMHQATNDIIVALKGISESVGSISEATSSVASAVEEQSATTSDISMNMQTAASSAQSISNSLQIVQTSSSHASSTCEQMLEASKDLSKQSEELNTQVDNFLVRVRAG